MIGPFPFPYQSAGPPKHEDPLQRAMQRRWWTGAQVPPGSEFKRRFLRDADSGVGTGI